MTVGVIQRKGTSISTYRVNVLFSEEEMKHIDNFIISARKKLKPNERINRHSLGKAAILKITGYKNGK